MSHYISVFNIQRGEGIYKLYIENVIEVRRGTQYIHLIQAKLSSFFYTLFTVKYLYIKKSGVKNILCQSVNHSTHKKPFNIITD